MQGCGLSAWKRTRTALAALALAFLALAGCGGPQWYDSFAEAEQRRQQDRKSDRSERTLFIFYKDHLDPNSGRMLEVLESPSVKPLLDAKIRCVLVKDFPPNQRYLAQYDVSSTPALVLVHPDGTYHVREGLLSANQTREFLTSSQPPGAQPKSNVGSLSVPDYAWIGSYDDAVKAAARQNRKLFILYKWWLSPESTELINRLSNARVRQQLGSMVHCILDWDYAPNRSFVGRYEINKVPAMIIVHPDGTYHAQVGLLTVDQIINFVAGARPPGRTPSGR